MKKNTNIILSLVITFLLTIGIIFSFTGCTRQIMAREFGGSYTIDLPKGEKLIEITWKDDDLFYLTRPMREDESPETYTFQQDSAYGIFEGSVTVVEH